jgi:FkbM family methyltransferase
MRTLLEQWVRRLARRRGIDLVRKPVPLLEHPGHELAIDIEFVLAHHALARGDLTFVQVGAYDGQSHDPLNKLLQRMPWRGVLLEPQPDAFQRLRETYKRNTRLTLINAAIAEKDGKRTLYCVGRKAIGSHWAQELASFDKAHLLKHAAYVPNIGDCIEELSVECITFDTLFERTNINHLDMIQIDTEGYDYEIIKLFDVKARKPSIVNFEHAHLSDDDWNSSVNMLISCGYQVALTGHDTLAYLREH